MLLQTLRSQAGDEQPFFISLNIVGSKYWHLQEKEGDYAVSYPPASLIYPQTFVSHEL
jgi:hypothetical protein